MDQRKTNFKGFTLVEILVAVFVLALGLLGLTGLQVAGLQNNHSAYLRSQATLLAYDMADRMRANASALSASAYDIPTPINNINCMSTTGCTSAQMAGHDMYEWSSNLSPNSVARVLPGGSGIVCLDGTPDDGTSATAAASCDGSANNYAIKVWWTDDRSSTEKRFVTTVSF